jgi:hypothetical protein
MEPLADGRAATPALEASVGGAEAAGGDRNRNDCADWSPATSDPGGGSCERSLGLLRPGKTNTRRCGALDAAVRIRARDGLGLKPDRVLRHRWWLLLLLGIGFAGEASTCTTVQRILSLTPHAGRIVRPGTTCSRLDANPWDNIPTERGHHLNQSIIQRVVMYSHACGHLDGTDTTHAFRGNGKGVRLDGLVIRTTIVPASRRHSNGQHR